MAYKALYELVLAHVYNLVPPPSAPPPTQSVTETSLLFLKPTKLILTSEALH